MKYKSKELGTWKLIFFLYNIIIDRKISAIIVVKKEYKIHIFRRTYCRPYLAWYARSTTRKWTFRMCTRVSTFFFAWRTRFFARIIASIHIYKYKKTTTVNYLVFLKLHNFMINLYIYTNSNSNSNLFNIYWINSINCKVYTHVWLQGLILLHISSHGTCSRPCLHFPQVPEHKSPHDNSFKQGSLHFSRTYWLLPSNSKKILLICQCVSTKS